MCSFIESSVQTKEDKHTFKPNYRQINCITALVLKWYFGASCVILSLIVRSQIVLFQCFHCHSLAFWTLSPSQPLLTTSLKFVRT